MTTGHPFGTIEDLALSRMLPQTREWIMRQVDNNPSVGAMWELLRRTENGDINTLMDVMTGKCDPQYVEVSERYKITRKDISNAIRLKLYRETRKGPNLDASLKEWQKELEREKWLTLYAPIEAEAETNGFIFAISAPWQVRVSSCSSKYQGDI